MPRWHHAELMGCLYSYHTNKHTKWKCEKENNLAFDIGKFLLIYFIVNADTIIFVYTKLSCFSGKTKLGTPLVTNPLRDDPPPSSPSKPFINWTTFFDKYYDYSPCMLLQSCEEWRQLLWILNGCTREAAQRMFYIIDLSLISFTTSKCKTFIA